MTEKTPRELRLEEALENLLGVVDTPIGRRWLGLETDAVFLVEARELAHGNDDAVEFMRAYHSDYSWAQLHEARFDGLCLDEGQAWRYEYTSKDGTGGKYDLLYRKLNVPAPQKEV